MYRLRHLIPTARRCRAGNGFRGERFFSSTPSTSTPKRRRRVVTLLAGSSLFAAVAITHHAQKDSRYHESLPPLVQQAISNQAWTDLVQKGMDAMDDVKSQWLNAGDREQSGANSDRFKGEKRPQEAVLSPLSRNALYLTLTLSDSADAEYCAAAVAKYAIGARAVQLAVGYSPRVWIEIQNKVPGGMPPEPFVYHSRSGKHGAMPATGGDIFVHLKGEDQSACFEVAQEVLRLLPKDALASVYGVQGFAYHPGAPPGRSRDLMVPAALGQANPGTQHEREDAALVPTTGGSYVLAQHWVHNQEKFAALAQEDREKVLGKRINADGASAYLGAQDLAGQPGKLPFAVKEGMPPDAHVARVLGADVHSRKLSVVRQSLPCGTLGAVDPAGQPGLYFVGYCRDPLVFWYMLDRMVGAKIREGRFEDGHGKRGWLPSALASWVTKEPVDGPKASSGNVPDRLMEYTRCVQGQCYYVPSLVQLQAVGDMETRGGF